MTSAIRNKMDRLPFELCPNRFANQRLNAPRTFVFTSDPSNILCPDSMLESRSL